jgi:hypothetical protein
MGASVIHARPAVQRGCQPEPPGSRTLFARPARAGSRARQSGAPISPAPAVVARSRGGRVPSWDRASDSGPGRDLASNTTADVERRLNSPQARDGAIFVVAPLATRR